MDGAKAKAKKGDKASSKRDKEQAKALAKEQKRKKQEQKAVKKDKKKSSKEKKHMGGGDEPDDMDDEEFDKIVAELLAKDIEHNLVTVERLESAPETRASSSLTLAGNNPQDGFVVFGGEFFDGATSRCFNDLLRFRFTQPNIALTSPFGGGEWRKITSPNSPPPRCAHASTTTPTHVYIFGGEFSTAWRFHHYNDLWRLDLKTNSWANMPSINGPSPRSGSRMVAWKNYLILFGGFYEASRGVRWHDDLHIYDLRQEKWSRAKFTSGASQSPSPRSGFQFACHPTKPMIFLYGGYSKVAASAAAQKGRAMDDMWILHLQLPGSGGGKQTNAYPECRWEYYPKKGAAPTTKRSGASSCVFKNRLLVFGGVSDVETHNDVMGEFHNSLHAFDMDRMRWYELGLRGVSLGGKRGRRNRKDGSSSVGGASTLASLEDYQDSEDDDEEEEDAGESAAKAFGLKDDAFYVIIDGKFVLVEQDEEDEEVSEVKNVQQKPQDEADSEAPAAVVEVQQQAAEEEKNAKDETAASDDRAEDATASANTEILPWGGQPAPAGRISAGLCVLGHRLIVYGGTCEKGDAQITFDDMWLLDLNKLDAWQELYSGTWRDQQWEGAEDDADDSDEDDDDEDDEDEEEDDQAEEEEEEEDDENEQNVRALNEEIKELRDELGVDQDFNTPNPGESMKDFFKRTLSHWLEECAKSKHHDVRMTGKDLRRLAFTIAKRRYDLLSPLLEKLNALQEAQRLAEEEAAEEARALAEKLARKNAKKMLKKKEEGE